MKKKLKGCTRKVRHASREAAERFRWPQQVVYRCRHCGAWHVGSTQWGRYANTH